MSCHTIFVIYPSNNSNLDFVSHAFLQTVMNSILQLLVLNLFPFNLAAWSLVMDDISVLHALVHDILVFLISPR
jgi:hypothetical protein